MTTRFTRASRSAFLLSSLIVLLAPFSAWADAIWTAFADGTQVNGNLYPNKEAVYLNGGPNNDNGNGLTNGDYYFQVTDPSGKVLLSTDSIACRQVTVAGGRIAGASGSCPHANAAPDPFGGIAVQLVPFADTPNGGGEYKVWLTAVGAYNPGKKACSYGFCSGDQTKTDNFKVDKPATPSPAYVIACKYNDLNQSGTQEDGEPTIAHWPMTATGVDAGGLNQTGLGGCVSWSVTNFPAGTITVTEGWMGDAWVQTAPTTGSARIAATDTLPATPAYSVDGGVVTTTDLQPGDVLEIYFGNFNAECADGTCVPPDCIVRAECTDFPGLTVTKDANPAFKTSWGIAKKASTTTLNTSGSGDVTYTVTLTNKGATDFTVTGTIRVSNPTIADADHVNVTDGTCTVVGGVDVTIPAGGFKDFDYSCSFDTMPVGAQTNTATATWLGGQGSATGTKDYDFANAIVYDGTITVSDPMAPSGTFTPVSYPTASKDFTYTVTLTGEAGKCVDRKNTATFVSTTPNSTATDKADATVSVCTGAPPTVTKTANTSYTRTYNWIIAKSVDKTLVEQFGGTATFNYIVTATETGFTDSAWKVKGDITVANPNTWESVTVDITDAISNGTNNCVVTGGSAVSVDASSSKTVSYVCSYGSQPVVDFTNTGTASWDAAAAYTTTGTATGSVGGSFSNATVTRVNQTVHVTDSYANALGTATANDGPSFTSQPFPYSRTVNVPATNCVTYPNTTTITETGANASKSVEVCGPKATGALTMGYWQNNNGQAAITGAGPSSGVCSLTASLRAYAPFQDLSATATCKDVAGYATNVIKAANASGAAMNAMLKGQMLATALDVLLWNKIGAPSAIGPVTIDLTKVCSNIATCTTFVNSSSVFGPANSLTVSQILTYAASQSNAGGSTWYAQNKANQELAKDVFDAINNAKAFSP